MTSDTPTSPLIDDEINLREVLLTLWSRRQLIASVSACTLLLATIYAFLLAKPVFVSSALLISTESETPDMNLGAAAAFLGGKGSGSADANLYQSLLRSRTVIHKALSSQIVNQSDTGMGRTEPLFKTIKLDTTDPRHLGDALQRLAKAVEVDSKDGGEGGILEVKFWASAPWLAQQFGNSLLEIGQEELRLVRLERSDVILSRLNVAVSIARSEWDTTATKLAFYKERNRSIILPDKLLELTRLEIENSAKEQKYLLARKEFEIQMLERTKAAPPMMILDPANLPSRKSKPKRALIMALGLLLGAMGSSLCVLARKSFGILPE